MNNNLTKKTIDLFNRIIENPKIEDLKCPIDESHILDFEIRSDQKRKKIHVRIFSESCDFAQDIIVNTSTDSAKNDGIDEWLDIQNPFE